MQKVLETLLTVSGLSSSLLTPDPENRIIVIYLCSDQCFNNNCSGDSTCLVEYGTYICACGPGFKGQRCDTEECQAESCFNNGTCVEEAYGLDCNCTEGFNGTRCENNIDDCAPVDPCLNGGTCQDGINAYNCICLSNYTGLTCESHCDGN